MKLRMIATTDYNFFQKEYLEKRLFQSNSIVDTNTVRGVCFTSSVIERSSGIKEMLGQFEGGRESHEGSDHHSG